jgi:hypothetical protein
VGEFCCSVTLLGAGVFSKVLPPSSSTAADEANKASQTGLPVVVPMTVRQRHFLRTMGVGGIDGELGCSCTLLGVGVFSPV